MARKYFRPKAPARKAVKTITIGGTPADADTLTLTSGNGIDLTLTFTGAETTATIASMLYAAITASDATTGLIDDETRSLGGQEIPEFAEFEASYTAATSVVTLTSVTAGQDFTVSVSKTGSLTVTLATVQAATGPNWFTATDNWEPSYVVSGDIAVFDDGSQDCTDGLDALRTGTLKVGVERGAGYTGMIGRDPINPLGFREYRPTGLQLYDNDGTGNVACTFFSDPNGGAGGITRLDNVGQIIDSLLMYDAGDILQGTPNVAIWGGEIETSIYAGRGSLVLDPDDAPSVGLQPPPTITVGGEGLQDNEVSFTVGRGVDISTLSGAAAVKLSGGETVFLVPTYVDATNKYAITQYDGVCEVRADGDLNAATIRGGAFRWIGAGTQQGTVEVYTGATLDVSYDGRAKTFGTLTGYGGSQFNLGSHSATVTPAGCTLSDITINRAA